jgi:hypothetical protein
MRTARVCAIATVAALVALALPAYAQSVISTRSGVVHYFEGAVYLDGQPLQTHLGRFAHMAAGADLRTADGNAEVLLTPGVFLRMGEHSEIRMVSNALSDTQVELTSGSIMVESGEPNAGTSVTLIDKDWKVHLLRKGVYRLDSDAPDLLVRDGEAEVTAKSSAQPISIHTGESLPFAKILVPEPGFPSTDALSNWAAGRSQSISADNTITAQIDQDPTAQMPGVDSFTYFPLLGLPAPLGSTGPYGYAITSQPGFNSIYLPGYTYAPVLLGLGSYGMGVGGGYGLRVGGLSTMRPLRLSPLSPVRPMGLSPGGGVLSPLSHAPIGLHPVPVRAGVHAVGRR